MSSQNWSKIRKPISQSVHWPEGRSAHVASHINDSVFVMIGGRGDIGPTLSDVWLCDTNTNKWKKVLSPFTNEFSYRYQQTHFSKSQPMNLDYPGGTMRVPSPSDRIYACARQFTMNLRYAFNNCTHVCVRTYVRIEHWAYYAINYAY